METHYSLAIALANVDRWHPIILSKTLFYLKLLSHVLRGVNQKNETMLSQNKK